MQRNISAKAMLEEIKTWYPVWYRQVADMVALWEAYSFHLTDIQFAKELAKSNQAINTMNEEAISLLENWLGLAHTTPHTLQDRRNFIIALIVGRGQIGRREIKAIVNQLIDGEVEVTFTAPGMLQIAIESIDSESPRFRDILALLDERLPAHLGLNVTFEAVNISKLLFTAGHAWSVTTTAISREIEL